MTGSESEAQTLGELHRVEGPASPAESFGPGSVVNGRYRVQAFLGRGGMGAVYAVEDPLYPGRPAALKMFLHRPAHSVDLFRAEFKTMASLRHPNVARVYDFETVSGREAFFYTMELVPGTSLAGLLHDGRGEDAPHALPWPEALAILVPVIRALSYLHRRRVVHFDLKPSNIMVGPPAEQRAVKVLDFGLSGLRQGVDTWAGTPIYMSPEIAQFALGDHRADLYSLGVMAYEMLAGVLPFDVEDSFARLLRRKLAEPIAFTGRAAEGVPGWLQQIVASLCQPEPDARPATAGDLLDAINHGGGLTYELETRDTSESYLFSSRFVGRLRELTEIQGFVRECLQSRRGDALLVAGKSGMGKSRLLREVREALQLRGTVFVEADCFERDLSEAGPLASLVLQGAGLARSVGAGALLEAHGPELVKLVPALAPAGEIVATPPLENADAERRRMQQAIARFFVDLGRFLPYVLYVNDLQWARDGTIDILAAIVREHVRGEAGPALAVLGSYRADEVLGRPVERLLKEPMPAGAVRTLELLPLPAPEVEDLLCSMLGLTSLPAGLAEGVMEACGGLPFFVEEILRDLLEQGRLRLARGVWSVEHESGALHFDAAASFRRRTERVSPGERRLLELLAVCGRPADPGVLATVIGVAPDAARIDLLALIDRQMVVPVAGERERYNLAHDRMREALYAGLDAGVRTGRHLALARTFAASLAPDDRGERLYETVGHFEPAESLLDGAFERLAVARLHLRAAQAVNATGAFATGVRHLERARALMPAAVFETDYALALAVDHTLAASLIPLGRIDEAVQVADRIVAHARTVLDEAPGWEARILACSARNQYDQAIDAGIAICGRLGLSLPRHPSRLAIVWVLARVLWRLRGRTDQELASLPPMDNPRAMRLIRIMSSMTACAYVNEPNLWPILIAHSVILMMRHGRGATHALLFGWLATALSAVGAHDRADRFARLAQRLMHAPDGVAFLPKLHHAMGQFLSHWGEPLTRSIEWCRTGFEVGQRVEDAEFAGYCHMGWAKASLEAGVGLRDVLATAKGALVTIQRSGQKGTELMHRPTLQSIENLLGLAPHRAALRGDSYDEAAVAGALSNAQDGFRLLEKARLACLFREPTGLALGDELVRVTEVGLPATFYLSIARYFACLTWLHECHRGAGWATRLRVRVRVGWHRRALRRWAIRCPDSFDHRFLLVEAERLRARGRGDEAVPVYGAAIAAAERNGFVQDVGLASELAAELHLARGERDRASARLLEALAAYERWGASAKVDDLRVRYPGL